MIVLGIDPGLDGAIGVLAANRIPDVVDLPTVPVESGVVTRRVHAPALRSLIRSLCPTQEPVIVVMEQLATGGAGRGNAMTIGSQFFSHATVLATLELLGLKPQIVSPQKWKRWYGLYGKEKTKADSLEVARQLYPACAEQLRRAKDHNRAESLLIARWAQQNLT
jgi:hypothetical protein